MLSVSIVPIDRYGDIVMQSTGRHPLTIAELVENVLVGFHLYEVFRVRVINRVFYGAAKRIYNERWKQYGPTLRKNLFARCIPNVYVLGHYIEQYPEFMRAVRNMINTYGSNAFLPFPGDDTCNVFGITISTREWNFHTWLVMRPEYEYICRNQETIRGQARCSR